MLINRIQVLKTSFEKDFDSFIIFDQANIQTNQIHMLYFTGFSGAAALIVPREGAAVLYVYSVNYEAAKAEARNCNVELVKVGEDLVKKIAKQVRILKLRRIGFDRMDTTTHAKLSKALKSHSKFEAKGEYVWNLRKIKNEEEINNIRRAAELTSEGMQSAQENIKIGIREYEVAAEIEYAMRIHGSYGVAFDTIVASGHHSAFPHGGCSEKRLQKRDLVVVDIGATYKNYRADMTRTFVVGRPSEKQKKLYNIVKRAQENAFQGIQEGKKAANVDAIARNIIEKHGYGKFFAHGLGHGIGLEVHEQPVLSPMSKDIIKTGNVVTDEPGIYIVGYGGIRIEDTVAVLKDGSEKLTSGSCTPESI